MSRIPNFLLITILFVSLVGCAENRAIVSSSPPTPLPGALDLNSAAAAELSELPGIGSGTAEKIVHFRSEYGPFRRPEQLLLVDGISERKFREIRPMIKVAKH